ncbi:hypothetical protein TNCV_4276591 [Trichonephila clavipes]|nr:hypothetical protein TNCV_4276591 [Trichonephila clavipes]
MLKGKQRGELKLVLSERRPSVPVKLAAEGHNTDYFRSFAYCSKCHLQFECTKTTVVRLLQFSERVVPFPFQRKNPEGPELAKNGHQHDRQVAKNGHQHDRQVAKMVTKNDANLALSPRFGQVPIE